MEYKFLAKYYDLFYKNKNYEKETKFLLSIMDGKKTILDAGCGTGEHIKLLQELGYEVDGFDLSQNMIEIAKTKTNGNIYSGNILTFNNGQKYDVIISMFAVFNHLKDYNEFIKAINNLLKSLNPNGILIIDLHNGRKSGNKTDNIGNLTRYMKWQFDKENMIENTQIKYQINKKRFDTSHIFKIYEIDKIKEMLDKSNINYNLYENYSLNIANDNSKNIQIVIYN